MSDMRSAIYDDEEDWENFKKQYGLKDEKWDVYSNQARFAQEAIKLKHLTKNRIKLYVRQQRELLDLKDRHNIEWKRLYEYEELGI